MLALTSNATPFVPTQLSGGSDWFGVKHQTAITIATSDDPAVLSSTVDLHDRGDQPSG